MHVHIRKVRTSFVKRNYDLVAIMLFWTFLFYLIYLIFKKNTNKFLKSDFFIFF